MPFQISTKTGDRGMSSLADGQRLAKTNTTFELIGELDELNSWLGLVVAELKANQKKLAKKPKSEKLLTDQLNLLGASQGWLYQVSALVAATPDFTFKSGVLQDLETQEDVLQASLAPNWHQHFLYPGGSVLGGQFDIVRTVARRVERRFLSWREQQNQASWQHSAIEAAEVQATLNRLSDYLYLLRCWVNLAQGVNEKELRRPI